MAQSKTLYIKHVENDSDSYAYVAYETSVDRYYVYMVSNGVEADMFFGYKTLDQAKDFADLVVANWGSLNL